MIVRRLSGADAALWQTLRLEALAAHPTAFMTTLEEARARTLESVAEQLDRPFTFGALVDGKLVGMLSAVPKTGAAAHRATIFAVYVASQARRRGVARALIDAAAKAVADVGVLQLELLVEAENSAAVALYLAAGFRETGHVPRAISHGGRFYDEVSMLRRLDG